MNEIAIALRSELYDRDELLRYAGLIDENKSASHIFFPDILSGLESIELSMAALAVTKRVKVGSGVIRLTEYDPRVFARRLETVQYLSKNRFILGIGTGNPGTSPGERIEAMLNSLNETRTSFKKSSSGRGVTFPKVLVAALRARIATISLERSDGLLLNFCSPEYAKHLISSSHKSESSNEMKKTMACYIKVFYSRSQAEAEQLLVKEFVNYDNFPQYHNMFEKAGIAGLISRSKLRLLSGTQEGVPDDLKRISLANPSKEELFSLLEKFRSAGVDLPCIYPYFGVKEKTEFKTSTIKSIASL